jgi:hypothetical protein
MGTRAAVPHQIDLSDETFSSTADLKQGIISIH